MIYKEEFLDAISFPLGGIGTGCVGLSGTGRLVDWEIFNRPAKGSLNGYTHIAVKAIGRDGTMIPRILNGDWNTELSGRYTKIPFHGFGVGIDGATMCGFPHFSGCEFQGEFPVAKLTFSDPAFPARVVLTAYNPMIPLDSKNSSLPAAFFHIEIINQSELDYEFQIAFSCANPFEVSENVDGSDGRYGMVTMKNAGADRSDPEYGDLTLSTDAPGANVQTYWYRGGWQDGIVTYWNEFSKKNSFLNRMYETPGCKDTCTVSVIKPVKASGSGTARFCLSWNVPNCYNYWDPVREENGKDVIWKNYYAALFEDSAASARYALDHLEYLFEKTMEFHDTLFSSTVDEAVKDAVSATMSVLKSPTVLRLENGAFYGWEGVHERTGSCEGTCQHVWNYAYALCFLFPDLERSVRDLEFQYLTKESGEMGFRLPLPLGRRNEKLFPCLDGQMGAILKTYREWKLSGDDNWLAGHWPKLKKIIEFAWDSHSPWEWDKNKDGVLEGRQHHTLDMELFGPSAWLQGFYCGALKVMSELAEHFGEKDKKEEYETLYRNAFDFSRRHLFNGCYFIQQIDLGDRAIPDHFKCAQTYWNEEAGQIKYQIAGGSSIDQLCAQWHADIIGLGDLFEPEQVKIALTSMYCNNFKKSMRDFANPWRIFALNDEAGAVICDYPPGSEKPVIPVPYCEETMHGFEYQFAGLLISRGFLEEGLSVVRGVRDRYDGKKRNPWNEIECGSNYARSMASFALLPILSGFAFDLPHRRIGFDPVSKDSYFKCFFSVQTGWGYFERTGVDAAIRLTAGSIRLSRISLPFIQKPVGVLINGANRAFSFEDGEFTFEEQDVTRFEVRYE